MGTQALESVGRAGFSREWVERRSRCQGLAEPKVVSQ